MKTLGRHLLVDFFGCERRLLADAGHVERTLVEAARRSGARIVEVVFHSFNPQGVSGVVVIAESHLAVHTWPEEGVASMDLFTCGEGVEPWTAVAVVKEGFAAQRSSVTELRRGGAPEPTPAP